MEQVKRIYLVPLTWSKQIIFKSMYWHLLRSTIQICYIWLYMEQFLRVSGSKCDRTITKSIWHFFSSRDEFRFSRLSIVRFCTADSGVKYWKGKLSAVCLGRTWHSNSDSSICKCFFSNRRQSDQSGQPEIWNHFLITLDRFWSLSWYLSNRSW